MAWRLAQKTAVAIPPTQGRAARRDVAAGEGGEGKRRRKEGVEEVADTVRGLDRRVSFAPIILTLVEKCLRLLRRGVDVRC